MKQDTALKLFLLLLGVGAVALVVFWKRTDSIGRIERGHELVTTGEKPRGTLDAPEKLPEEAAPGAPERVATSAPEERVAMTWPARLAGLTGRVVEADGTPVAGISVALLEFDSELLFPVRSAEADSTADSLELDAARTDSEGRFVLQGARAPAWRGLGVDLGGPRATLRVVEAALVHGESHDVGDVVLAPFGVLVGRVVDEAGEPVAGARVRVAPFPEEMLAGQPYELRVDTLGALTGFLEQGDDRGVLEPPRILRDVLDRLPLPTTRTGTDGTFRLEGVPLLEVIGGVDRAGYVGIPLGPLEVEEQAEHDLGTLVLTRGRTVSGVVETDEGDPVAGASVWAGAEVAPGGFAFLQPAGSTNAEGEFALTGVAPEGRVVAVARRSRDDPWLVHITTDHQNVLLALAPTAAVSVRVQDEAGAPLSGAHVRLVPRDEDSDMFFSEIFTVLQRDPYPPSRFAERERGLYLDETAQAGSYDVVVEHAGHARGTAPVEVAFDPVEVVVTCPAGRFVDLLVVDAATREAVSGARTRLVQASRGPTSMSGLAVDFTDAHGKARLGPFAERELGSGDKDVALAVRHPRYADVSLPLENVAGELVIPLDPGGTLAGRVHLGGELPTELYMLLLEARGVDGMVEVFRLPRMALTATDGTFEIHGLVPGAYRVEMLQRFLDDDLASRLDGDFEPVDVYSGEVQIDSGVTTRLEIDLTPSGLGPVARVLGHVRIDGRGVERMVVDVRGRSSRRVFTDAHGDYDTGEFPIRDNTWVKIEGNLPLPSGEAPSVELFNEWMSLEPGEVHRIELDLSPLILNATVVEAVSELPIIGAEVFAISREHGRRAGPRSSTGGSGDAAVWLLAPGPYDVRAEAQGFIAGGKWIEAETDGLALRIELSRSVPCAGRVVVPPRIELEDEQFTQMWVHESSGKANAETRLALPNWTFELDGLCPGEYEARMWIGGRQGTARFVLGPEGDRDLVLEFAERQD